MALGRADSSFFIRVTFFLAIFYGVSFCTTYTFSEPNGLEANWDNVSCWSPSNIPSNGDSIIINSGTLVIWGYNITFANLSISRYCGVLLIDSVLECGNISMVELSNFGLSNSTLYSPSE